MIFKKINRFLVDYIAKTQFATAATEEEAASLAAAKVAQMSLNKQIAVGTKAILAQAKAWLANPVGIITAIAAGIWIAIEAYKHFTISVEEHQQMLEDAKSSYNDTTSEIKNLNSQLTDTQSKISELEGYDKLSFTDQQELDRLRVQNEELQRELDLQKQLKDAKQQEVNNEFVDTMKADVGTSGEYKSAFEQEFDAWGVSSGRSINEMQYAKEQVEVYKQSIENYKKYQTELDKAKADGNKKAEAEAQKQVDIYKKQAEDASKYLNQRVGELTNVAKGVDEDENTKPFLDFINNLRDSWAIAFNEMSGDTDSWAKSQTDAFNRVANEDEFSSLVSDAKTLGSSLDLTKEKYKDFLQALIDSGFISDTSSESLEKVVNAINDIGDSASSATTCITPLASIPEIYNNIKDKAQLVSEAQSDMNDSGVVSVSTMADLIEKGLLTEDAFIRTANGYKISKSALDSLNGSVIQSYKTDFDNAMDAANDVYGAELTKQEGYDGTTESIIRQLKGKAALLEADLDSRHPVHNEFTEKYLDICRAINNLTNAQENLDKAKSLYHHTLQEEKSKSSSSSSKREIELYIADIDKLYDSEEKLAEIQNEIARVKSTNDITDDDKQKIKNLNKIIVLYEQERDALRELNQERRADILSKVDTLRGRGFDILYEPETNKLIIRNMEHINALKGDDIEKTNELRKATESLIDSIQRENNDAIKSSQDYLNLLLEIYNTQKTAIEDIVDLTMEMVKQEAKDEVDALEKQVDVYDKIIARRKKLLEDSKNERNHAEQIAEYTEKIAKLQGQISQLSLDGSREATAKKIDLQRQLSDTQKELTDYQSDYSIQQVEDSLVEQQTAFENEKQEEIDDVNKSVDTWKKVYDKAIKRIDKNWHGLYKQLTRYQDKYQNSIDGKNSLVTSWANATKAVKEYGSVTSALKNMGSNLGKPTGTNGNYDASKPVDGSLKNVETVYSKTKSKYGSPPDGKPLLKIGSSGSEVKWLQYYLDQLIYNGAGVLPADGTFWTRTETALKAFQKKVGTTQDGILGLKTAAHLPKYHTGGVVGSSGELDDREVLAILQKGELVLDDTKKQTLRSILSGLTSTVDDLIASNFSSKISSLNNAQMATVGGDTFAPHIEVNIEHHGSMSDDDAKYYGNAISENVLSKLNKAFNKRGAK